MAGLLETIAKRLLGSHNVNQTSASYLKATSSSMRTATKKAYEQPVRVKAVAPTVGPEKLSPYMEEINSVQIDANTYKPDVVMSEEESTMDHMTNENVITEDMDREDVSRAYADAINRINTREDVQEEIHEVDEKDDYLLRQIDEFREKAQKLQSLLLTKESKVMELQQIVDEREGKAKELETIIDTHQKKADGITEEVSKQIENLIDKVTSKMEQIGVSLGQELKDGQRLDGQQIEDLKTTLAALNGQQMEDLKETLGSMNEQQAVELKDALSSLNAQLEVVKSELSDKVHSENVKCYRNVSDLLKMLEDKLDTMAKVEKDIDSKTKSIKGCTVAIIVLTIINMLGIAAVILMELGVFKMFM